jgi:hypothetical protein
MAITIDFMAGDYEQSRNRKKIDDHTSFIESTLGAGSLTKIIANKDDVDSWDNVYFFFDKLAFENIQCWDELEEYAKNNYIYIYLYDHNKKERKGFFYDEDDVWVNLPANEKVEQEYSKKN